MFDEIGLSGGEGVESALVDGGKNVGPNGLDGTAKEQGKLGKSSGSSSEMQELGITVLVELVDNEKERFDVAGGGGMQGVTTTMFGVALDEGMVNLDGTKGFGIDAGLEGNGRVRDRKDLGSHGGILVTGEVGLTE